jgi:hypothetical protein
MRSSARPGTSERGFPLAVLPQLLRGIVTPQEAAAGTSAASSSRGSPDCKCERSAKTASAPERIRTSDLRFRRPTAIGGYGASQSQIVAPASPKSRQESFASARGTSCRPDAASPSLDRQRIVVATGASRVALLRASGGVGVRAGRLDAVGALVATRCGCSLVARLAIAGLRLRLVLRPATVKLLLLRLGRLLHLQDERTHVQLGRLPGG